MIIESYIVRSLRLKQFKGGTTMPVTNPVLRQSSGVAHIKSQSELDAIFSKATKAADKVRSGDAKHALEIYNKIVADGRHVKDFAANPATTAEKLGLKLSASEVAQVQAVLGKGGAVSDTVDLVAVAIIVLVLARVPDYEIVVDTAGMIKV